MATHDETEAPARLPVKLDSTTNGEYWPRPVPAALEQVRHQVLTQAQEDSRRMGISRRDYLASSCGAAAVFLAMNQLGCTGGRFQVPDDARNDRAAADAAMRGNEFIFDVQTHQVSAERQWWDTGRPSLGDFLKTTPQAQCGQDSWVKCFTDDVLIREVFLDSDTNLAVLSALWGEPNPMLVEEAARTREKVARLEGKKRLRIHAIVQPNDGSTAAQVDERMQAVAEEWKPDAWKLYPVWGPNGQGYALTDDVALRTVERGLALGVRRFAIHLGLPLPGMNPDFTRPKQVGQLAKRYPQATFLIYHSGYEPDQTEGPYNPKADRGIDVLIRSLQEAGVGADGNVYAELGSTWRESMKNPDEAAHVLGKLLKHVGEDRILWGTDAIWFGSPQDQIQAFRAFEITPEYQERYGYPALTRERKAKIFGLNGARVYEVNPEEIRQAQRADAVSRARTVYAEAPAPSLQTYGPRTRREMLRLLRLTGGRPD